MISRNLDMYKKLFSQYTELRVQENRVVTIEIVNGNVVKNSKNALSGVSARVCKGGSWGFASSAELSDEKIKKVLEIAKDNASLIDSKRNKNKMLLPYEGKEMIKDLSSTKRKFTEEEIMNFLKAVDSYIEKKYPILLSRRIILKSIDIEKSLLTSYESKLYSVLPKTNIYVELTIEKDGIPFDGMEKFGDFGEFGDNFNDPADLYKKIDEIYEHVVRKSEGVYPEAGVKECVLDSRITGVLAHEAVGHTVEADAVMAGSVAGHYLNKEVASPLINLVDLANSYKGDLCPVPIYMDDEGTVAEDTVIIENGILKSFMNSRETAEHFNVKPTGHGRAYEFSDEPLVRMRNTIILPGESKLNDMIASIEDGYYLIRSGNGQADSTGEFMFGVTLGYEIKNGKLARGIKDTTILGVAFELLKTATMVSDDLKIGSGMCGKKQWIPVGMGGPAIKCKVNIGGK